LITSDPVDRCHLGRSDRASESLSEAFLRRDAGRIAVQAGHRAQKQAKTVVFVGDEASAPIIAFVP
jgi:hypothetical protein